MGKASADIVLDLETTGKNAGCCILAIGATTVDESRSFYATVEHLSCLDQGLVDSHETMSWWDKQSKEAREEAFSGTKKLILALGEFSDFFRSVEGDKKFIWGNGAAFDIPILEAAYIACGMTIPWDFRNVRCYRTMKALYYEVKAEEFEGRKHNALDDAVFEARHLHSMLRKHFSLK